MAKGKGGSGGRAQYKYNIESALVITCTFSATMTVGTLSRPDQLAQIPDGCHVYAICTRPRLRLVATELVSEEDGISTFHITITTTDESASVRFGIQTPLPQGTTIKITDGGANAVFLLATGEVRTTIPAAFLLTQFIPPPLNDARPERVDREMLDLSVQYIGQAYGKDGSRDALRRLANHETLQKILGEINDQDSHRQAWITILRFDEHSSLSLIHPWRGTASNDEAIANMMGIQSATLPGNQMTTLAEGCLIRYFRPPFNERYKDTFPAIEHSSYKLPYKLDANSIGFEFETMSLGARFGSDTLTPRWIHTGLYALSDPSVRRAFVDFLTEPRDSGRRT
jgi:hypothetical protein